MKVRAAKSARISVAIAVCAMGCSSGAVGGESSIEGEVPAIDDDADPTPPTTTPADAEPSEPIAIGAASGAVALDFSASIIGTGDGFVGEIAIESASGTVALGGSKRAALVYEEIGRASCRERVYVLV